MEKTPANNETFEDPLQNYEPKTYTDKLEEAIAERKVVDIQHQPHASVHPEDTVDMAVKLLASQHVACLTVEEEGKLVGLFTEREVLNQVALQPEVLDQPIRRVMTTDPVFVYEQDPVAAALCVMAVSGYRHVPILDVNQHVLGIVSPQRVTKFLMKYFIH